MELAKNKNFDITTGIVYYGNRDPYHYIADLEEMLTHHCNFVIFPVTEEDVELHRQSLLEMFDVSQKSGLVVFAQPSGVGHVFDGFGTSRFVIEHRDSWQVLSNFKSAPAACMNNLEFRSFMRNWIDQVVELGVDGIAWDNPHYYIQRNKPGLLQWGCWCHNCNHLYLQKFNHRLPKGIGEEIYLLNEYTIINFLTELCDYDKDKNMINIVCLSPQNVNNLNIASWLQVSEIEAMDFFAAKAYWYYSRYRADSFIKGIVKKVREVCEKSDKKSQIWIQNFKLMNGEEKQVEKAIDVSMSEKIDSIVGWSFYGSRAISSLKCQNPKAVWDVMGSNFERFNSQ